MASLIFQFLINSLLSYIEFMYFEICYNKYNLLLNLEFQINYKF